MSTVRYLENRKFGTLSERFSHIQNDGNLHPVAKDTSGCNSTSRKRKFPRPSFRMYETRRELTEVEFRDVLDDEIGEYMEKNSPKREEDDDRVFTVLNVDTSNEKRKKRLLDMNIDRYMNITRGEL
jgi:hypothetical protein